MSDKEQKVFDAWFNFYKDKDEEDIKSRRGSNRDEAFRRGYLGFKIRSGDGNPYVKTSPLRIVYKAGKEIKKYHLKKKIDTQKKIIGKIMALSLVYVEWEDAYSREGWQTGHDLDLWKEQRFMVQQSGFVYSEDKNHMILTGGINPGDKHGEIQYKQAIKIPKSWVSARVDLTKYVKLCLGLNAADRKKIDNLLSSELKKLEKARIEDNNK